MAKKKPVSKKIYLVTALRWIARFLSILILLFSVLSLIGDMPDFAAFSDMEVLMFMAFAAMIGGFAIAWFREDIGSYTIFGSFAAFWLISLVFTGRLWVGIFFLIFPLGGLLFYAANYLTGKKAPVKKNPKKAVTT